MPKKSPSKANAAKRAALRYLTPEIESGRQIGWRFNPGPALRRAGVKSKILRRSDGVWLTLEEAQVYRDAAVAGVPAAEAAKAAAAPAPQVRRTLNALWALYLQSNAYTARNKDDLERDPKDKRPAHDDALADDTRRFYKTMIKHWLNLSGDQLVAALDAELIRESYLAMKVALTHSTADAALRALQAVLAFGVKVKWIDINPALGLKLARPEGRLRLGTPAEVAALVDAADSLAKRAGNNPKIAANWRAVGDVIVAAAWTAQRQADLLKCDLGRQFDGEFLTFARTHSDDTSQGKTGASVQVPMLTPLRDRLGARRLGPLAPYQPERVHASRRREDAADSFWNAHTFRHAFAQVREEAAKTVPSVADFEFRDLRDTAVTRLHDSGKTPLEIAQWSGHSFKSVGDILQEHYLVTNRDKQRESGQQFEAWRRRKGIKY